MRLTAGGVRELHWHKEAEWTLLLAGNARITAVDNDGHDFIADVEPGDLWYLPSGIPHSMQGLQPDSCEFLLAFPNGSFSGLRDYADVGLDAIELTRTGQSPATEKLISFCLWRTDLSSFRRWGTAAGIQVRHRRIFLLARLMTCMRLQNLVARERTLHPIGEAPHSCVLKRELDQEVTMMIDSTIFGAITIDGKKYEHDVVVRLSGEVVKRKKKLSKTLYGTSHVLSKDEAKFLFEKGCDQIVIGSGLGSRAAGIGDGGSNLARGRVGASCGQADSLQR